MDGATLSVSTLALGQTFVVYQFFMPPIREVRRASASDSDMRTDVLLGQVAAGLSTIAVGVMLGALAGSGMPVYVSVFIALVVGAVYQYALYVKGEGETDVIVG